MEEKPDNASQSGNTGNNQSNNQGNSGSTGNTGGRDTDRQTTTREPMEHRDYNPKIVKK